MCMGPGLGCVEGLPGLSRRWEGGGRWADGKGQGQPCLQLTGQLGGDLRGEVAGVNLSSGSSGPETTQLRGLPPNFQCSRSGVGLGVCAFNKFLLLLPGEGGRRGPHTATDQTVAQGQKFGGIWRARYGGRR